MKPSERDELLGRLDERSRNTWQSVKKIEEHLERLNDTVAENSTGIAVNRSGVKRIYWIIGGIILLLIALGGVVPALL